MAKTAFLFFSTVAAAVVGDGHTFSRNPSPESLGLKREKLSHLRFYFQSSPAPTPPRWEWGRPPWPTSLPRCSALWRFWTIPWLRGPNSAPSWWEELKECTHRRRRRNWVCWWWWILLSGRASITAYSQRFGTKHREEFEEKYEEFEDKLWRNTSIDSVISHFIMNESINK